MFYARYHRKNAESNGKNSGGRELLKSMGKGTRREALLGIRSSGTRGEAHIPQSLGTKGNQEGWPSRVEYRLGGTGGPHPGVDIFLDLSPRAKPYCGIKCSQGCISLPLIVEHGETGDTIPPQ